jgi:Leucine-rich repeat (LRR) protein
MNKKLYIHNEIVLNVKSFPIYLECIDISCVAFFNVFDHQLPPNLISLCIEHCLSFTLLKSKLPDTLKILSLIFNKMDSFIIYKLPPKLEILRVAYNKTKIFKCHLPNSLKLLYLNNNYIKKLKLNRVVENFQYDEQIKNKKTFHKQAFYKN